MNNENKTERADRAILLTSVPNARQLGGYVCADGRRIKDGALLRSAALTTLSSGDAKILEEKYRLKNIIDLRTKLEKKLFKDKTVHGAAYNSFTVYENFLYSEETFGMMDKFFKPNKTEPSIIDTNPKVLDMIVESLKAKEVEKMYSSILLSDDGQKGYAGFFNVLLNTPDDGAVLWHCSQGKDRAGLASALLLCALGASDETIKCDYLLSNKFYAEDIAKFERLGERCDLNPEEKREFLMIYGVNDFYLDLAIGSVKNEYGSVRGYLNHIGVSDDDIEILRNKFLEK